MSKVSLTITALWIHKDILFWLCDICAFMFVLFLPVCLQASLWDSCMYWWGSEELGAIRRRKKPIVNRAILKPKTKA